MGGMEQSSLSQSVLHDVAVQQQHIVQHNIHDIHHHPNIDQLHHINHGDQLFRPFFRDENHFIYNQQDIFAHQQQQQHHQQHQQQQAHHHHHPDDGPSQSPQQQATQPAQPSERPLDLASLDDEPLYVNAKQYFRILKRRVARTRLEEVHRLSRQRKPYLHESRHKHAMRRPRGPGGRFLTAEEIAAQKQAAQDDPGPSAAAAPDHDPDEEGDEDDSKPEESSASPAPEPDVFMPHQPSSDPVGMMTMAYRPLPSHQISQPSSQPQPPPSTVPPSAPLPQARPPSSPVAVYPQPQSQAPRPQTQDKGNPVTLTSPYPVQMHHVPHPHAHARHHHSNINAYMYNSDTVGPSTNPEMQRRTEEMIQFGAGSSSS